MALLDEAEVTLRISDSRRCRAELGIIELHRAESRLISADAIEIAGSSFGMMCSELRRIYPQGPFWESHPSIQNLFEEDIGVSHGVRIKLAVSNKLRRVRSLVNDGIHYLDRAEPVLCERRRNVWWTTWFFEKKLRLISMVIWSSIAETGVPIPYLGPEFAARGAGTLADEVLENGIRMSAIDAYRLATIVDAYASCAKALRFKIILDESLRLLFRQREMSRKLKLALGFLEEFAESRDSGRPPKHQMDEDISSYIGDVVLEARGICHELEETS